MKMIKKFWRSLDFVDVFFPRACFRCEDLLMDSESGVCLKCWDKLPISQDGIHKENAVMRVFGGRAMLKWGYYHFEYQKLSVIAKILQSIKYDGNQNLAYEMGLAIGNRVKKLLNVEGGIINGFGGKMILVPIPLHISKLRKRGYNQSFLIAKGIAEVTGWEINENVLIQHVRSKTQTKKNRIGRWLGSKEKFKVVANTRFIEENHIILVDDVITTGATIEAAFDVLINTMDGNNFHCSVISLALVL